MEVFWRELCDFVLIMEEKENVPVTVQLLVLIYVGCKSKPKNHTQETEQPLCLTHITPTPPQIKTMSNIKILELIIVKQLNVCFM